VDVLALISSQVAYVGKVSDEAEDCAGPLLLTEAVHQHQNCTRLLLWAAQVKLAQQFPECPLLSYTIHTAEHPRLPLLDTIHGNVT
jgi:hypothetical protein